MGVKAQFTNQAQVEAAGDLKRARNARRKEMRGAQSAATWDGCDSVQMLELVIAYAARGGAVLFGVTRDRGALTVKLYLDGEGVTEYIRPSDDCAKVLSALTDEIRDLVLSQPTK